jgi:hypothetical protein
VQNVSLILGGRPVISASEVSSTYSAHHTRYLISFDKGATLWLSLRRFNPIARAEQIAIPPHFHDLVKVIH